MIIDETLRNKIKNNSNKSFLKNFEKGVEQLNFEDGMYGILNFHSRNCIQVDFDNSWIFKVWKDGNYSMWYKGNRDVIIVACSYNELLAFMDKHRIRKHRESDYKNAELYVIQFENEW